MNYLLEVKLCLNNKFVKFFSFVFYDNNVTSNKYNLNYYMSSDKYFEEEFNLVLEKFQNRFVLILTATDLETEALHIYINPLPGFDKIIKVYKDTLTIFMGIFGNYYVAHVQSGMGAQSRDGSLLTTANAISFLKPKIVLMVGIAFGTDKRKQNIGDVLVSETVIPYNPKRVGKIETIQRGTHARASQVLVNRFKNLKSWDYPLAPNIKSKILITDLLSGEELIDNIEYRNQLVSIYPNSKGGEMEGVGVSSACDGKADWIIVKGICDYADGNKGKAKVKNQNIAVDAAIIACLEIFSTKTALRALEVYPINDQEVNKSELKIDHELSSLVLFELYDKTKEEYYVSRNIDIEFSNTIKFFGIWLSGPSGCGKTNLIFRNLIIQNKPYLSISLANCINSSIDDLFNEILTELYSLFENNQNPQLPTNFREIHKEIINILIKHLKDKEFYIIIEEIPIGNDENYKELISKFCSLLVDKNSKGLNKVKFILSSIKNPKVHLQDFHQKISSHFKFNEISLWSESDLKLLIEKIINLLKIDLPELFKKDLIQRSNGTPRFIKTFFLNLVATNNIDGTNLIQVLEETGR